MRLFRRSGEAARGVQAGRPLALGLLYPPIFVAVYLLHWTLLRLPYFWDEAGYYIPAAWDFLRLGTLIPETTVRNAHPPLPSILLAAWWKVAGFEPHNTRLFTCLVSSAALLAVYRIGRLLLGEAAAIALLLLTLAYPVWFAQSTLAHADIFAAAFTLWGISFYLHREAWTGGRPDETANAISTAALFSLACLAKETAIVTPAALFLYELWLWWRTREAVHRRWLLALAFPVLPLAGWFLYHRAVTGFAFGNPEFLRYNASANLSGKRVLLSLWHRAIHLLVHMGLWVPVLAAMVASRLPVRETGRSVGTGAAAPLGSERFGTAPPAVASAARGALLLLIVAHWIVFSVLGGALLTRYLLPAFPLLLLLCLEQWKRHLRWWPVPAAISLAAFAVASEVNPPYPFALEDNLSYRDMIVLQQAAVRVVSQRFAASTVLTAWPAAAELQRPELGYLRRPVRTVEIQNFSAAEIAKAAGERDSYDTALVFSTKYTPPPGRWNLPVALGSDERYYDFHHDLSPAEVAAALHGKVVWQAERKGQWAAVLRFDTETKNPH